MDLTEVWGKIHWLRVDTSSNQVRQGSKGNITGKKNSEQVVKIPGLQSQPHGWPTLEYWASWLASAWVGYLLYEMGSEKDMGKQQQQ